MNTHVSMVIPFPDNSFATSPFPAFGALPSDPSWSVFLAQPDDRAVRC
jgi:hypothetical protein